MRALAAIGGVAAGGGVAWTLGCALVASLARARLRPDCGTFAFDRTGWREGDHERRLDLAYGVDECHLLRPLSPRQLRSRLGPPGAVVAREVGDVWEYGELTVVVRDDRVRQVYVNDDLPP